MFWRFFSFRAGSFCRNTRPSRLAPYCRIRTCRSDGAAAAGSYAMRGVRDAPARRRRPRLNTATFALSMSLSGGPPGSTATIAFT